MPLALDPTETFDFVLDSDKGKPAAPALVFHHLTRREVRKADELYGRLKASTDEGETEGLLDEVIRLGLVGWKNMRGRDGKDVPYSGDPDDVLTLEEKWEVAFRYVTHGLELESKKKRSPSPSSPATDKSAPGAETAA